MVKSSDSLLPWLTALLDGRSPSTWQPHLLVWEAADPRRLAAWGLTPTTIEPHLEQRAEILRLVYPKFCQLCDRQLGAVDLYLPPLWQLWLPLAQQLIQQRQRLTRPLMQGLLGGQGAGKTTLGTILTLILQTQGYQLLNWSLDDLYKPYRDRQLLQQADPAFIWRGPPGTHEVELGIQVLDQLRHPTPGQPIAIPRFDKSLHHGMGDRIAPELVQDIDIVLFEGWFVGVQPVADAVLAQAPYPIQSDRDRAFAHTCNTHLHRYLSLWFRLDALWVLFLPDYTLSKQWRRQAEAQMQATGKPGMTAAEIDAFVEYFWKALHPDLFIRPAVATADLVIEVNPDHTPGNVYRGHQ